MTDFVLEQDNLIEQETSVGDDDFRKVSTRYANFLNQPLTLGMFVPCDTSGKPMKEPSLYKQWYGNYVQGSFNSGNAPCRAYQKAQEGVLFEGVKYNSESDILLFDTYLMPDYELDIYREEDGSTFHLDDGEHTINSLEMLTWMEITLTPTAIKQIGL